MRWLYVLIGGLLDVCWAIGLKYSEGFTVLWPSVFTAVCMVVGYWMFARAMKLLPVGTAYAVFIGIGSAGTAVVGMLFLMSLWVWHGFFS